jgi:hypothetical protein
MLLLMIINQNTVKIEDELVIDDATEMWFELKVWSFKKFRYVF